MSYFWTTALFWFSILRFAPPADAAGYYQPPLSDQLFCPDELPKGWYGDTPDKQLLRYTLAQLDVPLDDWSAQNFTSLTDLCAASGNPRANMGGRCVSSVLSSWPYSFHETFFDTTLAHAKGLWDLKLEIYCNDHCFCANNSDDWYALALSEAIVNRRIPPVAEWAEGFDGWDSDNNDDDDWGHGRGWLYQAADRACARPQAAAQSRVPPRPRWCPPLTAGQGRLASALRPATRPILGRLPMLG
ncbi:hypothetical protein MMC13_003892 [Lambiella insularis]|nr:hypothetical protein [Lambiella insularis]